VLAGEKKLLEVVDRGAERRIKKGRFGPGNGEEAIKIARKTAQIGRFFKCVSRWSFIEVDDSNCC
jgi:hypothetical protein